MAQASLSRRQLWGPLLSLRLSDIGWLLWFNLLFFQTWIQNAFGFSYVDELAVLALLAAAVAKTLVHREGGLAKEVRLSIACLGATCALGLLANYLYDIQGVHSAIAVDVFTCIKFPVALISSCVIFRDDDCIFRLVEVEARLLSVTMLILALANLLFDFGMGAGPRYGLRSSFSFVLGHPTMVVAANVGLTLILFRDRRRNAPWIVMSLAVICLSLRSKGLAYAAVAIFLWITYGKGRLSFFHVALGVLCAVLIGYDQFSYYFFSDGAARGELTRAAFEIAGDYFPLGSGFATYGSSVTSDPAAYSPLYYQYRLSGIYGLGPTNASFLSDTFWPTVMGQFGWVGACFYVLAVGSLFKWLLDMGTARLSVILCVSYLLISSTSEATLFHPLAIYLALCLGIVLSGQRRAVNISNRNKNK